MFGFSKKQELRTLANTSGQGVNVAVGNNATRENAQKYVNLATDATVYFNKKDTLTTILARCELFKGDSVDKNSEFYNDIQSLILIRLLLSGDIVFKTPVGNGYKILGNIPDINSFMRDNNLSKEKVNELSKVADEILKGKFNTNSIIFNCIKKLGFKIFKKALFVIVPGAGIAAGIIALVRRFAITYSLNHEENLQLPDYAKFAPEQIRNNITVGPNGQRIIINQPYTSLTFGDSELTMFRLDPGGIRYANNKLQGLPIIPDYVPNTLRPPIVPTFTPPVINPLLEPYGAARFAPAEQSPGYPKVPIHMFDVPELKAKFDILQTQKEEVFAYMSGEGFGRANYMEKSAKFDELAAEQQELFDRFRTEVLPVGKAEQARYIENYNEIRDQYLADVEEYKSTIINGINKYTDDYNTWALEYPENSLNYFEKEDPAGIEQIDKIIERQEEDQKPINMIDHEVLPSVGYFTLGVSILMILRQMQLSFRDEYKAFILAIIKLIDDFLVSKPIIMKMITSPDFTLPILSAANSNGKTNVPLYKNPEAVAVMWSYINKLNKRFEEPVKVQRMANFMLSPEALAKQKAWNSKPGKHFYRGVRSVPLPKFEMTENPLFARGSQPTTVVASVTENSLRSTLPNGWTEKVSTHRNPGRKYYVSQNGKVKQATLPTTVYNPLQTAGRTNTKRKSKNKFTRKSLRTKSRRIRPRRTLRKFRR